MGLIYKLEIRISRRKERGSLYLCFKSREDHDRRDELNSEQRWRAPMWRRRCLSSNKAPRNSIKREEKERCEQERKKIGPTTPTTNNNETTTSATPRRRPRDGGEKKAPLREDGGAGDDQWVCGSTIEQNRGDANHEESQRRRSNSDKLRWFSATRLIVKRWSFGAAA